MDPDIRALLPGALERALIIWDQQERLDFQPEFDVEFEKEICDET